MTLEQRERIVTDADLDPTCNAGPVRTKPIWGRVDGNKLREIPILMKRLGSDVVAFLDQKVALLKSELKSELKGYVKESAMLIVGGILVVFAALILNIAIGFFLARLFPFSLPISYGLGFLCLAAIYTIAGVVLLMVFRNKLKKRHLVPQKTVQELKRDKQWLRNEVV